MGKSVGGGDCTMWIEDRSVNKEILNGLYLIHGNRISSDIYEERK